MANRHFPAELVNQILGYACDKADGATLKASSLVCRPWRAISRQYVFRRIAITTQSSLKNLEAFLLSDPSVIHYIRVLIINPTLEGDQLPGPAVPSMLAPVLENLQTIELVHLYEADEYLDADFMTSFSSFTAVDTLAFRNCTIDPPLLYALVSALPALRTLIMCSIISREADPAPNILQLRSPRLESIDIYNPPTYLNGLNNILPWLATTESRDTIRSVKLSMHLHDAQAVGRFIDAVGARLEELDLNLDSYLQLPLETSTMKQSISIAHCSHLRSLTLYDENVTSAAIVGFINELNSPYMQTISLTLTSNAEDAMWLPDLSSLAAPLARVSLRSLEAVHIRYHGLLATDVVREQIERALPAVHARGIIEVSRT